MIASLSGRRRRGAPDDRSLGCVLRPSGLATVRGAREAPGPTYTRARGTKNEPTSGPAPLSTIDPFHPARVRLRPVGDSYRPAGDGQPHRQAWFNLAALPDPRAWLKARLGPLAAYEAALVVPSLLSPSGV